MADRIPLWPAWKFGLKQGDLVTTIHDRFNTIPMAIQEPNPFAADVVEISTEVDAFQELEEKLGARRDERLKELCDAFETIALSIIGRPSLLPTTFSSQTWANAVRLFRHRSFDALLNYFMSNMTSLDENVQPIISPLDNHLSEEAVAAAKIKCAADVTSSFDRRPSRFGETPALSSDAAAPLSDLREPKSEAEKRWKPAMISGAQQLGNL
ncbi:hypothetical protein BDY21DRAFT_375639 [Lineolata rhizophorae]|uniref:Uncharacterized protein n=1 Tax=Lineolata rhizophorae TaxID=578093 RepID=A0A6A6NKY6_9PEZI|nr:hypothetical protein BDY21DRAFT_375639 [Lineolata rhizophorae]